MEPVKQDFNNSSIGIKGHVKWKLTDLNNNIIEESNWEPNILTDIGRIWIARAFIGLIDKTKLDVDTTNFTQIPGIGFWAVGTGTVVPGSPDATRTSLVNELARKQVNAIDDVTNTTIFFVDELDNPVPSGQSNRIMVEVLFGRNEAIGSITEEGLFADFKIPGDPLSGPPDILDSDILDSGVLIHYRTHTPINHEADSVLNLAWRLVF